MNRKNQRRTILIERALLLIDLLEERGERGVCYEDVQRMFEGANRRTAYRWMNTATDVLRLERDKRDRRWYYYRRSKARLYQTTKKPE